MAALRVERHEGLVVLSIDRPERRNAIDVPTWRALHAALAEVAARDEDRAVVLTGAGGHFCAGGDLSGAAASGGPAAGAGIDTAVQAMRETVGAACLALHTLPKPVVAAVEGTAAGAGANLAFGCDLVVAAASARFGEVFVRRALPVDSGGSWLLPRLIGLQRAKELAFLGDWIGARQAERLGLVTRVVEEGRALAEAESLARRLVAASPRALAWIKRNLNQAFAMTFEEALEQEARGLADCLGTPEFAQALRELFSKRSG